MKERKIAVIGLGYVGLPIAVEFAKKMKVTGFDISSERVEVMRKGIDPSGELAPESFSGIDLQFTSHAQDLKACPTKELAFSSIFKSGYSPERINPGDKVHTLTNTVKIVSGCDDEALETIASVYEKIVVAGVHRTSSIKVAEAAKIIENTQRDVNIALMNELSIIFNRMKINTYDVIEAAGTKWNFLKFYPGLVGGHCIGVDPYYLVHKAKQKGYHAQLIDAGRFINDSMGAYIAKQTVKKILAGDKYLKEARVLVLGFTFKEDVSDVRNSKVADIIYELQSYRVHVDVVDPHADPHVVMKEYNIELREKPEGTYDAVIIAVAHKAYLEMTELDMERILEKGGLLVDVKGLYVHKVKNLNYWSL